MTDAEQRPQPTDSAGAAAEPGTGTGTARGVTAGVTGVAEDPYAPPAAERPQAEDNPYAPPKDDVPQQPSPWEAPPQTPSPWGAPPQQQPWGGGAPPPQQQPSPWGTPPQQPGPVQPWGAQRPGDPEQPNSGNWGDPNRYGQIRPPDQQDPDRRYRDQREVRQNQPPRRERDLPTRWALGLSFGATACTMLALYQGPSTFPAWMVGAGAGLALAIAAFVLALRAQKLASASGRRVPEATASLVSACVSGTLALLLLTTSIVWFGPLRDYAKCMQAANTQSAQDACVTQLENQTGMSTG